MNWRAPLENNQNRNMYVDIIGLKMLEFEKWNAGVTFFWTYAALINIQFGCIIVLL
jgi:hypothetical protein